MRLAKNEFDIIRALLEQQTGIYLKDNKDDMMESRLDKRLRILHLKSYEDYIEVLKNPNADELEHFINALSTNKTGFFREEDHFKYLRNNYLKDFSRREEDKGNSKIILSWCAACSSGQEAYTLAICFEEHAVINPNFKYKILATDINTEVLKAAQRGIFGEEEIQDVPPLFRQKYFIKLSNDSYEISEKIKKNICFQYNNLNEDSLLWNWKFDIIFLRNVFIYFQKKMIQKIIINVENYLNKEGVLFIGHCESINNVEHQLRTVDHSIFTK